MIRRTLIQSIDLEPFSAIEAVEGNQFRTLGAGASLRLRSRHAFPSGPVQIGFKLEETQIPIEMVIRVKRIGERVTEIVLPQYRKGIIRLTLQLPINILSIFFIFKNQPGLFKISGVFIRPLSRPSYILAKARNLSTLKRAAQFFLQHGLKFTLQKAFITHHHKGADPYLEWIRQYDTLTEADVGAIRLHIKALSYRPLISIIMPVYNTRPAHLIRAIESVRAQIYPYWELCIADDASTNPAIHQILDRCSGKDKRIKVIRRKVNGGICAASNTALRGVSGVFVALLDHDDELSAHALYMVAVELFKHPTAELIYSDEDKIDAEGHRYDPYFKSDWNFDLFTGYNMISHLGVYRAERLRALGGFRKEFEGSQDYDLALRFAAIVSQTDIRHIPFVLYHWRVFETSGSFSTNSLDQATDSAERALQNYLDKREISAQVVSSESGPTHRILYPLPSPPPMVTVLVPTRDRVDLLRECVTGVLERSDYSNLEVIILDNESREPATLAYFGSLKSESRIRIEHYAGPFNFSAMNNLGAKTARGEILALVNNDIEVISGNWLDEMVRHAVRSNVGAVGAKLLYPDDTIQHGGVILGIGGIAGHAFKYAPKDAAGYFRRALLTQNLSAITGACMVLRKECYFAVGGMDAEDLKVGFNDIDLCLKLRAAGYDIVWTPHAVLRHRESASRGKDNHSKQNAYVVSERKTMIQRWGYLLRSDPFYNPNLSLESEDFCLASPPRVDRPWLAYRMAKARNLPNQ